MTKAGLASLVAIALGAGVVGCDDSVAPTPMGAANYKFSKTLDGQCDKVANPNAGVGSVTGKDHTSATDGQDDAQVTCRVTQSGGGYDVSVSVQNNSERFSLSGTIVPGQENNVKVAVYSDVVKSPFTSLSSAPCKAWVTADTANPSLSISPGKVWGAFRCEKLYENGNNNTAPCGILNGDDKAPGGFFVFENCDQE